MRSSAVWQGSHGSSLMLRDSFDCTCGDPSRVYSWEYINLDGGSAMRNVLLATVAVVAALNVAGGAYAADMQLKAAPAPVLEAAPSWSGAYLGARGGWGWGTADYLNLGGSSTGGTFGGVTVPFSTSFGARGS